jgi:hypothetical protein
MYQTKTFWLTFILFGGDNLIKKLLRTKNRSIY